MSGQDLRTFLSEYTAAHPEDVIEISEPVSYDQEVSAIVWALAANGHHELLRFTNIDARAAPLITNVFASRRRIERILAAKPGRLHDRYEELAGRRRAMRHVDGGPVLDCVTVGDEIDLGRLPLIKHFAADQGGYITSGVMVAEDPITGCGNLSYHRAVVAGRTTLGTSLHSRGDLWRLLEGARERGESLPVAYVIGAHPLFMLAAAARVPMDVDEREIAGGLLGDALDVVGTPHHAIAVPAAAEYVLEGVLDPERRVQEGPFGEFSGYSSDRSTHSCFEVDAIMHRVDPLWIDVAGGNSNDHLNLARIPRESEMRAKLMARFPSVRHVQYPNSGTHFHCYVAIDQRRAGEARQAMLALLGWDPYLKTVVAVDSDVDVTDDSAVLWALAAHLQPANDVFIIEGLPGSALDPSSSPDGTTSRMGLDATRGLGFEPSRIAISPEARTRAAEIVSRLRFGREP